SDPTPLFRQYAQQLGLNLTKYTTDYQSSAVNDTINADMDAGTKLKVTGTPTFFIIDGKGSKPRQIQVGEAVSEFEKILNAELKKKGSATSSGSTAQTKSTSSDSKSSGN
ncbi:MAG TPA: DsbA family protein, partial [Candidatus Saccharimonadales bacterium]|nr:DsbA family protein [Candidatus Saccharimonadales bacterium]